jgi:hypothetical protein
MTIRIIISVLGVVLGLALIANGAVLIGCLIIAMAILRVVLVFNRRQRWQARRQQFQQRRGGAQGWHP